MTTHCKATQLEFQGAGRRQVIGKFDGGRISSDGGVVMLRDLEERTRILRRFGECFVDHRDPRRIEHFVETLVKQRVMGLVLGYEDLNDHDELRDDYLLAVACGCADPTGARRTRTSDRGSPLAGKSTLNRLELTPPDATSESRYKKITVNTDAIDALLVDCFLESFGEVPEQIVLDVDATDDPLHGKQEGRFFHGYYREYCYLPLYVFCGEHLLCARLRTASGDGAAGTREEIEPIVRRIREAWPGVQIIVRGDGGFCRDDIMDWCENNGVDFVLGLAKNARLKKIIAADLRRAKALHGESGKAERVFTDFTYRTLTSWSRKRRVVGKAEYLPKGENPRFIVTSLDAESHDARWLYEDFYCARGDMENRIKEQQLDMFADCTPTHALWSNQLRLYFSSLAYVFLQTLRRVALKGTQLAKAQCGTIRLKLLKLGTLVRISVRKVWLSFSESYPHADLFRQVLANLQRYPPRY